MARMAASATLRLSLAVAIVACALGAVEPATKISFSDSHSGQPLVGLGVRKKGPIKVYGVGMYVDSFGSKLSLSKYKKFKESVSTLPKAFYEDMVKGGFGKTLVLKMAYGVSKEKMAGALADSIKPRMPKGGSSDSTVAEFERLLLAGCEAYAKGGRAGAGTEFTFGLKGGSMGIKVNGKKAGSISSKPLCKALLNCYFDGKTVSPALKSSCADGLLKLL